MWCLFGTVSSESLLTTCGCVDCSVPDRVKVYLQHVAVSPVQYLSSESLFTTCGCLDCSEPDRVKVDLQHVAVSPVQYRVEWKFTYNMWLCSLLSTLLSESLLKHLTVSPVQHNMWLCWLLSTWSNESLFTTCVCVAYSRGCIGYHCLDCSVPDRVKAYLQHVAVLIAQYLIEWKFTYNMCLYRLFSTLSNESLLTTCGCVDLSAHCRVKVYFLHVYVYELTVKQANCL